MLPSPLRIRACGEWSARSFAGRAAGVVALLLLVAFLARTTIAGAAEHTNERVVRFGMVTSLSGGAADLGRAVRAGVEAAFAEHNRDNAGTGLRVELIAADDSYEPGRTGQLARSLIEQDRVIGLIGNVGTPTGVVAMPICIESKVLYLAPFSGARSLRPTPPDPFVFHLRASYDQELDAMVAALIEHAGLAPTDIAFFTQRDAYGDAGFGAGLTALRRRGLAESVRPLHARYERNTLDVEAAVADCLEASVRPRAVIMVGTYRSCAQFIRLSHESHFTPLFLNVSFVGAEALAADLGPLGDGVIVTQVVPTLDRLGALGGELDAAMATLPEANRVTPTLAAVEGFLAGRLAVKALRKASNPADPASVAEALASLGEFDLGMGTRLRLDGTRHQASDLVQPSVLRWRGAPSVERFEWAELGGARPTSPTSPERSAGAVSDERGGEP